MLSARPTLDSAPRDAADLFLDHLSAALEVAGRSTTSKTRLAKNRIFSLWGTFCNSVGQSATLDGIPDRETKFAYLFTFAYRYGL